jgi:hypothetical protein
MTGTTWIVNAKELKFTRVPGLISLRGRAAAEAVAAARKSVVVLVLVERHLSVVLGTLLRAGLVVRAVQMKRSMGVAADESERQQ